MYNSTGPLKSMMLLPSTRSRNWLIILS